MEKLVTSYLGLTLKSPLIVSSSRLTSTSAHLEEAEENGAGAVVLKSLFEEQILHHISTLSVSQNYPEADDYISYYTRSHSVEEYLNLIGNARKRIKIPVIPSINCFSSEGWISFAKNIADSGADAIEINVFFMPLDRKRSSGDAEKIYFELIEKLKATVSIPIAIKIGSRFSNILYMIDQFYMRGVEGVVMFNRFYEQDINIDISASTGVHSGEDAVRYLLAGADSVQVCSVLYKKGLSFLKTMNHQLSEWMDLKNFKNINEFRGKLNWVNYEKPDVFERTQFMKYFSSVD
jgi:dihydroorotate dehydrogenase (fumarate)